MFVFLSKFLPLLVYPLGLACILLALAVLLHRVRAGRTVLVAAAFLLLWLGGNRWVAYSLARSLEWRYLPQTDLAPADVILVLGGGTEPALTPRQYVEVNAAGDRVLYAGRLYKQGKAARILLSGGNISWAGENDSTPAQDMLELLELLGIPRGAVLLQTQSENTHDDALFSNRILQEHNLKKVILVTSALHMPRSVALFRHLGVEVIPAPVDFTVTRAGWNDLLHGNFTAQFINFFPTASNLAITTNALKEYIGLLAYKFQGWL